MLLSFIPSALLQNSSNCDRKYLDNKISSVEITGQMGPDRAEDRGKETIAQSCVNSGDVFLCISQDGLFFFNRTI